MPSTLIKRFTRSSEPNCARKVARIASPTWRAATFPACKSRSWPTLPVIVVVLVVGCDKQQPAFETKFFSAVEVIGRRGAGIGELNKPRSVALDRQDNLYVVDMTGRVQKFSPAGQFLLSWQMPQTDKGKPK